MEKKRKDAPEELRCKAFTNKNERCPYQHVYDSEFCKKHRDNHNNNEPKKVEVGICKALTNKMLQCPFKHIMNSEYCVKHTKKREFGTTDNPIEKKKNEIAEELYNEVLDIVSYIIPRNMTDFELYL